MAIESFDESTKERLSALADGELEGDDRAALCAAWSRASDVRRDWHAWHLIGDVLRSEDLASDPRRDCRLRAAVHARLRIEAVVMAPAMLSTPAAAPRSRRALGAAIAAGLVLVVGVFALTRPGDAPAPPVTAQAGSGSQATVVAAAAPPAVELPAPVEAEPVIADVRLIRDAQLDRYLAAHKQFAGSSALGVPSAFLRSATVDTASR